MASMLRYWKRYTFGTLVTFWVGQYVTKKIRENAVIRELCSQAKLHGEECVGLYQKPRKVIVFLNPQANSMKAKRQFNKYASPLLHISGLHVTVIESEYQGQMRTLMNYIDPHVDSIVVAGGDGALLEVLNGLMRRKDASQLASLSFGLIPLGKENRFYKSRGPWSETPARTIGQATMAIIKGHTSPVNIMELQPDKGRTLYAMSSISWGVLKEAQESKDSYWLFGPLRLFFSCLSIITRRWPVDSCLHLWLPPQLAVPVVHSAPPPPSDNRHLQYKSHDSHVTASLFSSAGLAQLLGVNHSHCISSPPLTLGKSTVQDGHRPTQALPSGRPGWSHRKLECSGFNLMLNQTLQQDLNLTLTIWPLSLAKSLFLEYGWNKGVMANFPCETFKSSEFVIHPKGSKPQMWLSVDGEGYEPMSFSVKVLPNAVKFCDVCV